jgi:hypothetical protein
MKLTTLNLVLLVIVALLGTAVGLTRPSSPQAPPNERAFVAFDPATLLEIQIHSRVTQAPAVILQRESAEAPWTVQNRAGFWAEAYPIEQLLGQITNLQARDLVTESADGLTLFGLGPDAGIEVVLKSPGAADWRFVFADARAGGQGYVRAAGDERVFALPGFVALGLEARQWIRPGVFDLSQAAVRRIEIGLAGETLSVARDDKGIWREQVTGKVAPRVSLEDLLADLDALAVIDIVEREAEAPGAQGLDLGLFDAEGQELAGLVLDLQSNEQGRRRIAARAWAQAGHDQWVGLIDDAQGALIMKRINSVFVALAK